MKNLRYIIPVLFNKPATAAKVKRDVEYPLNITQTILLPLITAKSRVSKMYKAEEKIWNKVIST
jgi:hypothetical protein